MMKKNMKENGWFTRYGYEPFHWRTFAAAPAFDTPQEWLAASQQQTAQKLKEEASRKCL